MIHSTDGKCDLDFQFDLFMQDENKKKKEGWINLYKRFNSVPSNECKVYSSDIIHKTKEDAFEVGSKFLDYLTTVKIEWEE